MYRAALLSLLLLPSTALAADVNVKGNSVGGPSNCIPFGGYSALPTGYAGFVYKNLPAFEIQAGDTISFDLGAANNVPISMNIALAAATSNGSMEQSTAGWTSVVSNGTPSDPDGDNIQGNFELTFTVDSSFSFAGGGLLIRFQRSSAAYIADTDCTQVLMHSDATDTSNLFAGRFYSDLNGNYPWSGTDGFHIGNMVISCPTQIGYSDDDGDGFGDSGSPISGSCTATSSGVVSDSTDCDDGSASVYPGATEYCNSIDDDCDGTIDEDDAFDVSTWYADTDVDGYGDASVSDIDCDQPSGFVADSTDCDDTTFSTNPGADEYCNGVDDDCDTIIDEDGAVDVLTWYADTDVDGYGDPAVSDIDCAQPSGFVADNTDCDDATFSTNPGADEYCNGVDDDCDTAIDEDSALDVLTWYRDSDVDGYGDPAVSDIDCAQPSGFVADATDCDDSTFSTNPGADEYCNSVDDDCDGSIDEDSAVDVATWYADTDTDGYGDAATSDIDCDQPTGFVSDNTDCDDTVATTYPGADEYCNSVDDDCDGDIDEDDAVDVITWYADSDTDGYGDAAVSDLDCDQPTGFVEDDTDCDDTVSTTYPGADEYCNTVDDDCDGDIDEDDAVDVITWHVDGDEDGFGDPSATDIDCDQPSGHVEDGTDCDDTDPTIYPGATEIEYDGIDQNCDGEDLCDVDEDTFNALECGGDDCDDTDELVNSDALEIWYDGVDQDCDGLSDYDADMDGFDSETYAGDDCDDADDETYPGAPDDYYDGVVNDCDESDEYDADGDGYDSADYGGDDCDDARSDVNTGATEVWYDGTDQDCDGEDDDQDRDGYLQADDCDDTDPDSYPGAEGLDENCDEVEEDNSGLGVDTGGSTGSGDIGSATGGGGFHGCGSDSKGAWGLGFLALLGLGLAGRRRD